VPDQSGNEIMVLELSLKDTGDLSKGQGEHGLWLLLTSGNWNPAFSEGHVMVSYSLVTQNCLQSDAGSWKAF